MAKDRYTIEVDEITMDDMLVFEKATGSKLLDALSPRLIKDNDGQVVMVPEDPENPESRLRPLRAVNMTTIEMVGSLLIAKRQADRDHQAQWTSLDQVKQVKLTKTEFVIDWGQDEDDSTVDPTEPVEPTTGNS